MGIYYLVYVYRTREWMKHIINSGTTAFFVCMHYHPELNDKIELMAAMAPVTTFGHIKANARHLAPFRRFLQVHYYTIFDYIRSITIFSII